MGTLRNALVDIETAFSASYLDTTPVQYDNRPTIKPAGEAFIHFAIEIPEGDTLTMDESVVELTGFVSVMIYTPKNEGIWNLIDVADAVRKALSNVHIGDVVFEASSGIESAPEENEFFVTSITTFFSIVERN